ncbi:NfeD family protein [Maritimibacter fusiformis]|uniref:Activity regulator of membrane protease YbbK n=1 Tax=Maritimibacter fusiformis TaxID=2603819 RepID=A0A5D0RA14_9RHOB|nr:hypothetical protein [Maritimibacter fusiformis]TYB77538.1 hypothetical protein FVF75_14815 [Maritimibacter fusiformis]
MIWEIWWAWLAFGLGLAILEVFTSGFIFLGFAIGAVALGIVLAFGVVFTLAWALVVFAVISVIAWVALRQVFGVRKGQFKTFERDINED